MQLRSSGTTRQQVSVLLVFFGFTSSYLVPVFPAAKIPLPLLFCRPAVQDKTPGDCGALIILVFLVLPQRHALSANAVPARYRLYMYE